MFINHRVPNKNFFNADIILIQKGESNTIKKFEDIRPISLLNTDYKIYSKILALRIQSVINVLIHNDQTGYMNKRNILDNVALLKFLESIDELQYTYQLYVDFIKAFDTLSHSYI